MLKSSLLIGAAALALTDCNPNVQTRGHVKDANWEEAMQPGTTTREDVLASFGSPSTRSSFGPEVWYYITTRRENFAFFKPEIADQDVLAVTFSQSGTVEAVQHVGKEGLKDIEYSSRETPTEGQEYGLAEQFIGNLGRFNSPGGAAGSVRRGGGGSGVPGR